MPAVSVSRGSARSGDALDPTAAVPASAPATRSWRSRRRDPRLWVGAALVAVSVVAGSRVFAAADDTTQVWAFSRDVAEGARLTDADLAVAAVHLTEAQAGVYLPASDGPPVGRTVAADAAAGALVAVSALGDDGTRPPELPLAVAAVDIPAGLAPPDRVQVWAVPRSGGDRQAELVFDQVRVVSVESGDALAGGSERQVLVAPEPGSDLGPALAAVADARVVLVRVGRP